MCFSKCYVKLNKWIYWFVSHQLFCQHSLTWLQIKWLFLPQNSFSFLARPLNLSLTTSTVTSGRCCSCMILISSISNFRINWWWYNSAGDTTQPVLQAFLPYFSKRKTVNIPWHDSSILRQDKKEKQQKCPSVFPCFWRSGWAQWWLTEVKTESAAGEHEVFFLYPVSTRDLLQVWE